MTILVIDQAKRGEIARAIEVARANVIMWERLKHIAIADPKPTLMLNERGTRPDDVPPSIAVHFEGGVTAALSFEEQPAGMFRHLSVSTGKPGKDHLPHPALMADLSREFGFRKFPPAPATGRMWIEEFSPNRFAVNVIEIEPSPSND